MILQKLELAQKVFYWYKKRLVNLKMFNVIAAINN